MDGKWTHKKILNFIFHQMLKSQWSITINLVEWLKLKRLIISSVDEDMEELELSYLTGGM